MASLFIYMNGYEVGEYAQEQNGAQYRDLLRAKLLVFL